jgi:hypothetical protein
MWMGPVLPLAIKLVAFREGAFVQTGEGRSHLSMNERSSGFDDDRDLVIVVEAEPEEGHDLGAQPLAGKRRRSFIA